MNARTTSFRFGCPMTESRAKDYYEELKSLFSKQDSDWSDKAKSVRTIAHQFYAEITGADKDCTYASAIGRFFPVNSERYEKAKALKNELNNVIHNNIIISRKDYLAIYDSFVQQISFATKVFPDQKTLDLLCKHHRETPAEKEIRFRECIKEAIDNKQKVMLYGYCSCNSDSKLNRTIEPIEFICDERSIWACEEKQDESVVLRQFKLSRVDNVEILEESWSHENIHCGAFVDSFGWARTTKPTIHITIFLGPSAKNHLVEMCPESRKYITPAGGGQWLLDTDVHDLAPVKRFCQEHMSTITVFVPDELKQALGIEEPSREDELKETVITNTGILDIETGAHGPEHEIVLECGFKGMLKKIGEAIREYIQEKRFNTDAKGLELPTAKTTSTLVTNAIL